jgi:hypothetical protein
MFWQDSTELEKKKKKKKNLKCEESCKEEREKLEDRREKERRDETMFWQDVTELESDKKAKKKKKVRMADEEEDQKKKDRRLINLLEHKANEIENVLNNVDDENKGWEFISILIDPGSTETVAPDSSLSEYKLTATDWSEAGKGYTAANGTDIPNLGEKVVRGQAANGMWCTMRFQICSVTKPLGSVSRICQAGSRVVFGPPSEGSYIEHVTTGRRTMLRQSKGLYYLDMWIAPESVFPRPGNRS